jgi:hypothetical protein
MLREHKQDVRSENAARMSRSWQSKTKRAGEESTGP